MRNDSAPDGVRVKIGHAMECRSRVADNGALAQPFPHLADSLLLRLVDVKVPKLRPDSLAFSFQTRTPSSTDTTVTDARWP